MNNNYTNERAHLGVFSTTSYVSIGDPYAKKAEADPRLKGKQFSAEFPKEGLGGARPINSLFEREHKWLFGGEKYKDRTTYLQTQPRETRKKGFDSTDASRRDEFTLDIETQKWRERISTEMLFAERFAKHQEETMSPEERAMLATLAAEPERRWTHGPKYLFDLGKEAAGGTTPYEMKDGRDTWYSKHRVKEMDDGARHTGGVMLSSHAYGDNLKNYNDWSKPEFARQPIIRDNFFRSTGVLRKTTTF
uniref:Flagellar associated protein n=1 Tax=Haptolina ericina TaxID=156174 RepID=A0A7S3EYS5_9EUKA|eukprot:CAMPEP_0181208260 /NCGR_PEP_ID=MMETSP1096-20121128/22024_1 /TAXON_ID=156174 ORGANISM="Chrysochromulina ericina, Strain CCMP281" /NCGR_SAMPLE_ID=MMETSP1096 /ASSEMBLY_ACC=CAM_ASM_000453 /LENGTH=248 /DNA_ID=CAMNT_0023299315 /DNA_START=68 /DNA_END=814 /DNA_ORIENTATION=+